MDQDDGQALPVPPAVQAITDEGLPKQHVPRVTLERSASTDIRAEGAELKQAAEESLNVILDLTLDGKVRWASTTWQDVVGIPFEEVEGKPIADLVVDKKDAFSKALEDMRKNDSGSKIVRFSVASNNPQGQDEDPTASNDETAEDQEEDEPNVTLLEAQGILVFDRTTGEETHVSVMEKFP